MDNRPLHFKIRFLRNKAKKCLSLFLLLLPLVLAACSSGGPTADEVLEEILRETAPLPAGQVRLLGEEEYSRYYAPEAYFAQFFDEETLPTGLVGIAVFSVSSPSVGEIGVAAAETESDARDLAMLCQRRLADLREASGISREEKEVLMAGQVIVNRRYLLWVILPESQDVALAFRHAMRWK